jgi:ligand-binding sensor domain-containing protein
MAKKFRNFKLMLFLVFISGFIFGQSGNKLFFSHITKANGLPSSQVNCFIQDYEGYVWIGTNYGLVRFDGHNMQVYLSNPDDSSSLADNMVIALHQTKDSSIWIGTSEGLSVFNPRTGKIHSFPQILKVREPVQLNSIRCFFEDSSGLLWAGSNEGLILILSGGNKINIVPVNNNKNLLDREFYYNSIYCIAEDLFDRNKLVLGTGGGLLTFDKKSQRIGKDYFKYIHKIVLVPNDLLVDQEGFVWICGWNAGINRLNLKTGEWKEYPLVHDHPMTIFRIMEAGKEEIWLSTADDGLGLFNKKTGSIRFFKHDPFDPNSLISNTIQQTAFFNKEKKLWVATDAGISVENRLFHSFQNIKVPFKFNWVNDFYHDISHKKLYVGAYGSRGLFEFDEKRNQWTLIPDKDFKDTTLFCATTIFCDHKGVIWVATRNNLKILDTIKHCLRLYRDFDNHPLPMKDAVIYSIIEDHEGNLWVGSRLEGVYRIDKNRQHVTNFRHEVGKPFSLIEGTYFFTIHTGKFGRIWMGCRNGVSIFDPVNNRFQNSLMDTLKHYGIHKTWVNGIEMDTLGRMWIGIDGAGLVRVEEPRKNIFRIKVFHSGNGMESQSIGCMTHDRDGNLWLVSGGLLCFNPYKEIFHLIDERNGLQENISSVPLIHIDSAMNVFVSSGIGYETRNIREIEFPTTEPVKMIIQSVEINGKTETERFRINNGLTLAFPADRNNFLFRYTAICFRDVDQINYRYKLLGYDKEWISAEKSREARYTNLPAGYYEFLVEVLDSGKWVESAHHICFIIKPQIWRTWWFMLTCSIVIILLITVVYKYRVRQLLKMERMRTRIATDLHDDVSSTLSSISIYSEILVKQIADPHSASLIMEIGNNARDMLERIDDIIWSVNPKNDKFGDLGLRINEFAIPLFENRNIRFQIDSPDSINDLSLQMEIRRNVYLIAKEAINNLVKYSACENVSIIFSREHNLLIMEIKDDGKGFDSDLKTKRNGLRNMKDRAIRIKGVLKIQSVLGVGTQIRLEVLC